MKMIIFAFTILISTACQEKPKQNTATMTTTILTPITDEVLETSIIYEANIRQYSPEGSFKAFTKDIPKLKEMGVTILWVMPIYPISHTRRKATGGAFADDLEDPALREKALGSYYAIADYKGVNPEFGTIEDFRELVRVAHKNGIYVILDWVANHTGWDHTWLREHPEWYTKDEQGNVTHPVGTDWTDTADLNYDNWEMREQMVQDMLYWVKQENIDGFRCDMAAMVPTDFWKGAIERLRAEKPLFMLAEAWEPHLMDNGFDMAYGWETHHVMNRIAKGENSVAAWDHRMHEVDSMYRSHHMLMNFTSNHDENSWAGSVFERMGPATETFAALSYATPSMPLIYSGQEYDMDKRLLFFEKDTIEKKENSEFFEIYKRLGALKKEQLALNGGKDPGSYQRINTSDNVHVLAFERAKEGQRVIYVANMSNEPREFTLDYEGSFKDHKTGDELSFNGETTHVFEPWEYHILIAQ